MFDVALRGMFEKMTMIKAIALSTALAVASTAALAFQEEQTAPPPEAAAKKAQPAADAAATPPAANFSASEATKEGTEVRIPGLGKLGVLPKMDFGLELLYGAAETKQPDQQPEATTTDDDLMIRGTVKHRF